MIDRPVRLSARARRLPAWALLAIALPLSPALAQSPPQVSIEAGAASITEGATSTFILTANPPSNAAFTVTVELTGGEEFGVREEAETTRTVMFDANAATSSLAVGTEDDNIDDANSVLTATVVSDTGYTVGTPSSARVIIRDDDVVVSLSVSATRVSENGLVTITVSAPEAPPVEREIRVSVTAPHLSASSTERVFTLTPGKRRSTQDLFTFQEYDDGEVLADRSFTLSLVPGTGYEINPDKSSVTVSVLDDDVPVSIAAPDAPVPESRSVEFILTASAEPLEAFTVSVDLDGGNTFRAPGDAALRMIAFGAGDRSKTLTVDLVDDSEVELSDTLTAALRPGIGFMLSASSSATAILEDNDLMVSVAPGSASVTEGDEATFELTAELSKGASWNSTLTVNVSLTGGEAFGVREATIRTVEFAPGDTTATLAVQTENDDVDEPDGTLTATVRPGDWYTLGATSSVDVTLTDNDVTLTLSASATTTSERGEVTITVHANEAPPVARVVRLQPTYDESPLAVVEVTLPAGLLSATGTVSVLSEDDDVVDANSTLVVSLASSTGYQIGAADNTVTITVRDDDIAVSIAGPTTPVSEAGAVEFVLAANAPAFTPFTVTVAVSGGDTFRSPDDNADEYEIEFRTLSQIDLLLWINSPESFEFTRTLTLDLDDDDTVEASATLTATLQPGLGFRPGATSTATVELADDDVVVSIAVSSSTITEGERVTFMLIASETPPSPITLSVLFEGGTAHGLGFEDHLQPLALSTTGATTTHFIDTTDDDVFETDGTLTATIHPGTGYRVHPSAGAVTVTVVSDDIPPATPDVNGDDQVNANDALILYYAYSLRSSLGDGR